MTLQQLVRYVPKAKAQALIHTGAINVQESALLRHPDGMVRSHAMVAGTVGVWLIHHRDTSKQGCVAVTCHDGAVVGRSLFHVP